jgi:hypothetical protein
MNMTRNKAPNTQEIPRSRFVGNMVITGDQVKKNGTGAGTGETAESVNVRTKFISYAGIAD